MMSEPICTMAGCAKPVRARGWCSMHYQRWKKHGDPAYRHQYWPPKLVMKLEDMLSRGWSDQRIGRALGKSPSSIHKARLRYKLKPAYRQHHTAREVCRILGVHHMTPQRWIADGRLKARKGARYGLQRVWMITEEDLLAFLEDPDNWHCWEPWAIQDRFLREWAIELRGDVRFCTPKEAAARLGLTVMQVWHLLDRGVLPHRRDGRIIWIPDDAVDAFAVGEAVAA